MHSTYRLSIFFKEIVACKKTQKIAKYDEIIENLAILTRKNKRNTMKFSENIEFM